MGNTPGLQGAIWHRQPLARLDLWGAGCAHRPRFAGGARADPTPSGGNTEPSAPALSQGLEWQPDYASTLATFYNATLETLTSAKVSTLSPCGILGGCAPLAARPAPAWVPRCSQTAALRSPPTLYCASKAAWFCSRSAGHAEAAEKQLPASTQYPPPLAGSERLGNREDAGQDHVDRGRCHRTGCEQARACCILTPSLKHSVHMAGPAHAQVGDLQPGRAACHPPPWQECNPRGTAASAPLQAILLLVNAIYFKGSWASQFMK